MKPRESKILDKARRWRKKAYDADKAKSLPERSREAEGLARQLGLPLAGAQESDGACRR